MPRSCLIVDDSPTLRRVLRRMLEQLGFVPDEAADGVEALERCRASMPDIIFLDWNMPRMDGLSFLEALRSEGGGDRPVVIFCTTMDDIEHIQQALDHGADEYIIKPFDIDLVKSKLLQTGVL